uniref:Uncharacterized protein n=1 Tax=Vespula pensylvanica TaxID=30213 RepID=A0A834PF38_VESPE|nr:hypothetical protein H0235_001049 [Vespula pensylvanica]
MFEKEAWLDPVQRPTVPPRCEYQRVPLLAPPPPPPPPSPQAGCAGGGGGSARRGNGGDGGSWCRAD